MNQIINKLEAHESKTPSRWREAAEYRQANKSWLRHSQRIAMLMLDKMDELHLTQTEPVSYTHLTLPTTLHECRSRWSPYH